MKALPDGYHTDQTNLHSIVKHMAVSATTVKVLTMAIFITLLLIDYPAVARAIVGNLAFFFAWWADARFLQYEREMRAKCELTKSHAKMISYGTFWSWTVAPYYLILLASLLLLLISKEF